MFQKMYLFHLTMAFAMLVTIQGQIEDSLRVDCHPDPGVDEDSCLTRGCLFQGM